MATSTALAGRSVRPRTQARAHGDSDTALATGRVGSAPAPARDQPPATDLPRDRTPRLLRDRPGENCDDVPRFSSAGHVFVFVCARCGAELTAPLSPVALPAHAHQKYGNGLRLPVLMETGTFAEDPEPWDRHGGRGRRSIRPRQCPAASTRRSTPSPTGPPTRSSTGVGTFLWAKDQALRLCIDPMFPEDRWGADEPTNSSTSCAGSAPISGAGR